MLVSLTLPHNGNEARRGFYTFYFKKPGIVSRGVLKARMISYSRRFSARLQKFGVEVPMETKTILLSSTLAIKQPL